MKIEFVRAGFLIAALLVPAASYAADSDTDRAHPAAFVKDSVITTKIKSQLAAEHLGSVKHIQVDTDNMGVVWLSGTANTQQEIDQAVAIARKTDGVKSVKNDLKVQMDR